jgi:membrane protein required for colicin V production
LTLFALLDLVLLGMLGYFILAGVRKGFIKQIIDFVGLVLAVVLPALYGPGVARAIVARTDWTYGAVVGFVYAVSFFAVLIGVGILGSLLKKGIRLTILGWIDKAAGGLMGLVKSALALSIILLLLLQIPWGEGVTRTIHRSRLVPVIVPLAPRTFDFMMRLLAQDRRFESVAEWESWIEPLDSE